MLDGFSWDSLKVLGLPLGISGPRNWSVGFLCVLKRGVGCGFLGRSLGSLGVEGYFQISMSFGSFWLHLNPFGAPFWLILDHWGLPGLSWGRLGSPWAPEGSQRRSWERRAGSLDPPWVPESGPKMGAKIDEKTLENLYVFLGGFQGPLREALGLQSCICLAPKNL